MILLPGVLCSQVVTAQTGSNCNDAMAFCTGTNYTFPNSTNVPSLGNVACLGSTPNPIWYYMQVETAGNIDITMNQTSGGGGGLDVDFAVWGPFPSLAAGCGNPFPPGAPVDCSYSTAATETANIPNAPAGSFYIMLITNFSNQNGTITFNQSGGAGTTDCGLLSNADNNGPLCEGETLILEGDAQNTANSTFNWYTLPGWNPIGSGQTVSIPGVTTAQAGQYGLIVIDNATLESDTSYTVVVVHPIPDAPTFTSTAPACQGSTVTLTPDNIVPGATYHWTGSPNGYTSNQTVATFANANPAIFNSDYSLTVTINGCTSPPYTQNLIIYPTIIPLLAGPTEACEGATVPVDVTNGSSFVSFSWGGVAGSDPQQLPAGTHTVTATDSHGCETTSAPHTITLIPNPLEITGDSTFCEGSPIVLTATPGKQSYQWNNGGGTQNTTTVLQDGPVIVHVVSQEGCERADTLVVKMYDKPQVTFAPTKICDGDVVSFQNGTALDDEYGSIQQGWSWDFGHLNPDTTQAVSSLENPTHLFPGHGDYNVKLVVESNHGCLDTTVYVFHVIQKPQLWFNYQSLCFGQAMFMNTSTQGDYPFQSVNWNFGDGVGSSTSTDSIVSYTYPSIATYPVTLTVTDSEGCVSSLTQDVTLKDTPMFDEIPNVITPNGDNLNDDYTFLPIFEDCYNYTFAVFNRWGSKVFETEKSNKGFAGISGLGSKLQNGVYFWVLIANPRKNGESEQILKKGTITIVGTK